MVSYIHLTGKKECDMKRLTLILLCALLALSLTLPACAESIGVTENYVLYAAESGTQADFDGDGIEEIVYLTFVTDEYGDGAFTLTVNDQSFTQEGCSGLDSTLYTLQRGGDGWWDSTLFMINEYGPSDDPLTYVYIYSSGVLSRVGWLPDLVTDMVFCPDDTILLSVRASTIGTWYRSSTYKLATGFDMMSEAYEPYYTLCEVPAGTYAKGEIVQALLPVETWSSPWCEYAGDPFEEGEWLCLAATDDCSRLFLTSMDQTRSGWVRISKEDYMDMIESGDTWYTVDEIFANILWAD